MFIFYFCYMSIVIVRGALVLSHSGTRGVEAAIILDTASPYPRGKEHDESCIGSGASTRK